MKQCPKCNSEHEKSGKFCSRKCANSRVWSEKDKEIKSISGKNSEKVKVANRKRAKGKDERECSVCKIKFSCYHSRVKKYCSLNCSSKDESRRLSISNTRKKLFFEGKIKITGGTTKWYQVLCLNGLVKVQGSYEVRTCIILDTWVVKGKILSWEYTSDRICYVGEDNKKHSYLLDFKVFTLDGSSYYIETKGYKTKKDILKWTAAKKEGLKLEVWFEEEITKAEQANQVKAQD